MRQSDGAGGYIRKQRAFEQVSSLHTSKKEDGNQAFHTSLNQTKGGTAIPDCTQSWLGNVQRAGR